MKSINKNNGNKKRFAATITAAVFCLSFLIVSGGGIFAAWASFFSHTPPRHAYAAESAELITTRQGLIDAMRFAGDGDTLLVGDIDFTAFLGPNLTINKNIVIKSGLARQAVIRNCTAAIRGDTAENESVTVRLENIRFQGAFDLEQIDFGDGSTAAGEGALEFDKIQFISKRTAVFFIGFVNAEMINCDFIGYVYDNGCAICGIYSDAASAAYRLSLTLADCRFYGNAAKDYGGALYFSGKNNNIRVDITDCEFYENRFGVTGAIYAYDAKLNIRNSKIFNNRCIGTPPNWAGGALSVYYGELTATNTRIYGNTAANGGGVCVYNSTAAFDGCVIAGNTALYKGGGAYIETSEFHPVQLVNTSIYLNGAAVDGVAVYVQEWENTGVGSIGSGRIDFAFCTVADNSYAALPFAMQFWDKQNVRMFGCAVIDDAAGERAFPAAPDYNYTAKLPQAGADGVLFREDAETAYFLPASLTVGSGVNGFEIPLAAVQTAVFGRFSNSYGAFYTGANADIDAPVLFNLDSACGECVFSEVEYRYGCGFPPLPVPTMRGHTFNGWYFDDGRAVNPDGFILGGGVKALTLTAGYAANTYAVTLIADGRTEQIAATFGAEFSPAPPEKSGYKFAGWYTGGNGTGEKITAGSAYLYDGDITLYARFTKNFPVLAVVLPIAGALLLAAGFAVYILKFKKRTALQSAPAAASGESAAPNAFPLDFGKALNAMAASYKLTARETEVCRLIADGLTARQISGEIKIKYDTVLFHSKNLYNKLGVNSKIELIRLLEKHNG